MITIISTLTIVRTVLIKVLGAALVLAACGEGAGADGGDREAPTLVVTTSVLGDVLDHLVADAARVEVLMPPGADPHEFALSARQAVAMRQADLLVVNGLGLEEGLADAVASAQADGVPVLDVADLIGEDDDPHVLGDPVRMGKAAAALDGALPDRVAGLDSPDVRQAAADYLDDLDALDADVRAILAPIEPARRRIVTYHDGLGAFATRYDLEVVDTILGQSTLAEPSAAQVAAVVERLDAEDIRVIFTDASSPTRLAEAIADEGRSVEVVPLYTESLGEPGSGADTYVAMVRTNAERIAAALR
jgi:zinc/manganese transport system substrate-binding protein